MSLKSKLTELIQQRGYLSYSEAEEMCNKGKFGRMYKIDTFRRRADEVSDIEPDGKDEKGYVKGWKWIGKKLEYKYAKVEGTDKLVIIGIK